MWSGAFQAMLEYLFTVSWLAAIRYQYCITTCHLRYHICDHACFSQSDYCTSNGLDDA